MQPGDFRALIAKEKLSLVELRDKRYDAVIHMRTAALGAEKYYKNSATRRESIDEARTLDQRTLEAWLGTPHLHVIDNRTNFKGKIERLKRIIAHSIGHPQPREMEKKFLVSPISPSEIPVPSQTVQITQYYLLNDLCPERIRIRSQNFGRAYFHTIKQGKPGDLIEHDRQISEIDFQIFMQRQDLKRHAISKSRTCFIWNEHYYELDTFNWPLKGLFILEAERHYPRQKIEIPPFVNVVKDVSKDPHYTNFHLARI